jgi:predicted nucleotidyltransferase
MERPTMRSADEILSDITRTIVARFSPERIVLFGSRARGDHDGEPDFDIFVEMESSQRPVDRDVEVNLSLSPRDYSLDVLVYTPAEVGARRGIPGSLVDLVEAEGRVLYERHR